MTNGQQFHAYTKWHVDWKFWWDRDHGAACRITSVRTSLTALITLPKLVGGNSAQRLEFERYVLALKQHESGHYEIGKDAAHEIDREILSLSATDCSTLEKTANQKATRILERYKEKERTYDADTKHGKTQGAWLKGDGPRKTRWLLSGRTTSLARPGATESGYLISRRLLDRWNAHGRYIAQIFQGTRPPVRRSRYARHQLIPFRRHKASRPASDR